MRCERRRAAARGRRRLQLGSAKRHARAARGRALARRADRRRRRAHALARASIPTTDAQQLRSLVRAARKDAALRPSSASGRAYRELFQFIKRLQQTDADDERRPRTDALSIRCASASSRSATAPPAASTRTRAFPRCRHWLERALRNPIDWETRLIPDEQPRISADADRARRRRRAATSCSPPAAPARRRAT